MKIAIALLVAIIFAFYVNASTNEHESMVDIDPRQNTSNPCVWVFNKTGQSNHTYNLTNARGVTKDYNITYGGVDYVLNLCTPTILPCKTANSPTGQRNSVGCQPGTGTNNTYSIGQLLQAFGSEPEGKYLQLNYTQGTPIAGSSPAIYRKMVIKCQCGTADPGNFEFTSIDAPTGTYFLTFNSKWSCAVGAKPSGGGGSGGGSAFDVGFIIIIAAVGALVLYFIVGAIVNKAILKKEGIEIIPNVGFWTELPSLIKDGFLFVYYKIRGRGYSSV